MTDATFIRISINIYQLKVLKFHFNFVNIKLDIDSSLFFYLLTSYISLYKMRTVSCQKSGWFFSKCTKFWPADFDQRFIIKFFIKRDISKTPNWRYFKNFRWQQKKNWRSKEYIEVVLVQKVPKPVGKSIRDRYLL